MPGELSSSGDATPSPVVVTACSDGTLGVKCLFWSCNRILRYPTRGDEKAAQMLGVALLPADDPSHGITEAVSVSANGCAP